MILFNKIKAFYLQIISLFYLIVFSAFFSAGSAYAISTLQKQEIAKIYYRARTEDVSQIMQDKKTLWVYSLFYLR